MKILSEKTIFNNQVFKAMSCHVRDNDENEVQDYLIVEPKIKDKENVSGVAILPYFDEKICCINIFRPALGKNSLEIPHGFVEENESFEDACLRELTEETGITAKKENLKFLCSVAPDGGVIRGIVKLYFVNCEKPSRSVVSELGLGSIVLFEKEKFLSKAFDEEIIDSFSLVAFFTALKRGFI